MILQLHYIPTVEIKQDSYGERVETLARVVSCTRISCKDTFLGQNSQSPIIECKVSDADAGLSRRKDIRAFLDDIDQYNM